MRIPSCPAAVIGSQCNNVTGKLGRRKDDELEPEYKQFLELDFTVNKVFLQRTLLRPFLVRPRIGGKE